MSTKAQLLREEEITAESDLPEGWAAAEIGEVSHVVGGGTPKTSVSDNFSEDGQPWLTPADLSGFEGMYIKRGRRGLSEKGFRSCGATAMPPGTVLMSSRAPIGYVAIAANPIATSQGFKSFVLPNGIVPEYCYFWLKYKRDDLQELGSGTTFLEISGAKAKEIPFIFAPYEEQRRISRALEEVTSRTKSPLNHLGRAKQLLANFRQSVLAAACSGKLTEEWRVQHPDVDLNQKLDLKKIDGPTEIPDSWIWITFGSILSELKNGISTKPEIEPPGRPILRISAVRSGSVSLEDRRYLRAKEKFSEYGLREGDLLFTRYNGSLDLLGVCGQVRNLGGELLYPDKLMRVRFGHGLVLPSYAEIFFGSTGARERITDGAVSSAGQQGISGAKVKAQPFALPPFEEQDEIVRRVEALFKLADAIEKRVAAATARAENLTQAVLAKAFRGELVSTEAELARREGRDYEPASVLLERIRAERQTKAANRKNNRI
ncbi:MAG: restriction endonuclease subunit S [Terriglobia bacterium]|nr:restriction endonuclease subunit S [Terriglobia bacterium]